VLAGVAAAVTYYGKVGGSIAPFVISGVAIVGSVLANVLLVLGLAFIAGGARNGVQRFEPRGARRVSLMLGTSHDEGSEEGPGWPLWLALTMLAVTGVAAAFVSDWFVAGLTPAISAQHISPAFAGLVIVAIAGNAVENVVGVQLAYRNQPDHALPVILQSPVQIVMMVAPALVLLSPVVGASFTLVLPPLLLVALLVAVVVAVVAVQDGDSTLAGGWHLP
jgi:Ca2+:H+ antiporter